jgi:Transcription factor WhiB
MAPVTARRPWPTTETRRGPGGVPGRALIRTAKTPAPRLPDAACAGQSTDFFPDTDAGVAAAKAVCATCPVRTRTTCLEGAQARGERFGVWGGVDFEDGNRKPARSPQTGKLPRGVQALKTAAQLGELRGQHRTLRAVAEAAGLSSETARFYLTLLDLDPDSQERVRSGEITPSDAVAAVRAGRRSRAVAS